MDKFMQRYIFEVLLHNKYHDSSHLRILTM